MPAPWPTFTDEDRGLFLLDEAHYAFPDFQYLFDKLKLATFHVIIAATRRYNDNSVSPVGFQILSFQDIKLTDIEAHSLYNSLISGISSPLALESADDSNVKAAVLEQCGGHVGTLVLTLSQFHQFNRERPQSPGDLVQLLFSRAFTEKYTRIWAESFQFQYTDRYRHAFMQLLCGSAKLASKTVKELLQQLERGFIIEPQTTASSPQFLFPLARRRIIGNVFPQFAVDDKFGARWTIDDLIFQAVHSFEPKLLEQASVDAVSKEAAIQHMFFRGLVSRIAINHGVVSEKCPRFCRLQVG
jgi:hypothetical protein